MKHKHWRLFEGVVAALERSSLDVPGALVIPNARVPLYGSRRTRQVDVVVEIPTGSRRLRVGVEVRDTASPLDVTKVEQLGAKLQKLQLDRRCIVSRRGYSADATTESARWGLELRTLEEVAAPEWWQAPFFVMTSRTVELLAWRLDYSPEDLDRVRVAIASIPGDAALLVTPSEPPANFRAVIANAGRDYVDEPAQAGLPDGHVFALEVALELPSGSYLEVGATRLPVPVAVFCQFRFHVVTETVSVASFQVNEHTNAFTGVWAAQAKQLTMVTQGRPDGARSYSFSLAEAAPPPTTLPSVVSPPTAARKPRQTRRAGRTRGGSPHRGA